MPPSTCCVGTVGPHWPLSCCWRTQGPHCYGFVSMAYLTLTIGLALPWLLGFALLLALDWPTPRDEARGTAALRTGYGLLVGLLLLTLWMRAVSAVGVPFGWASIGAPLMVITAALLASAARAGRLRLSDARAALIALLRPGIGGWRQVMWTAIIAW